MCQAMPVLLSALKARHVPRSAAFQLCAGASQKLQPAWCVYVGCDHTAYTYLYTGWRWRTSAMASHICSMHVRGALQCTITYWLLRNHVKRASEFQEGFDKVPDEGGVTRYVDLRLPIVAPSYLAASSLREPCLLALAGVPSLPVHAVERASAPGVHLGQSAV